MQEKKYFASYNDFSLSSLHDIERAGIVMPIIIGGRTYYSEAQQVRIKIALKGRRLGFSLQEIRHLLDAASTKNGE